MSDKTHRNAAISYTGEGAFTLIERNSESFFDHCTTSNLISIRGLFSEKKILVLTGARRNRTHCELDLVSIE